MDIIRMIGDLRTEQKRIQEAILALERVAPRGTGKRRGRPPKWMLAEKGAESNAEPKKRVISPGARKRMAAAQRRRWAAKRKTT